MVDHISRRHTRRRRELNFQLHAIDHAIRDLRREREEDDPEVEMNQTVEGSQGIKDHPGNLSSEVDDDDEEDDQLVDEDPDDDEPTGRLRQMVKIKREQMDESL